MKFPKFADLILFENDDVIVVNKPPFLSSLDEREGGEINLLRLAKGYWDDAQICHRLDKETSGALIIAKNPEAYRTVSMQFEKRQVKKVYHAIIEGTHVFEKLLVDLPILNVGKNTVSISRNDGKRAETWFQSLKYFKHYTLVECRPVTGRAKCTRSGYIWLPSGLLLPGTKCTRVSLFSCRRSNVNTI